MPRDKRDFYLFNLRLIQIVFATILWLFSSTLWAERAVTPFNIRTFSSTLDAQSLVITERAVGLETGELNFGLMTDFDFSPLSQSFEVNGQRQRAELIERYTTAQLSISLGLFGHLTLGVSQPFLIIKGDLDGPGDDPAFSTDGLGDTRGMLKALILDSRYWPIGIALATSADFALVQTHPLSTEALQPLLTSWFILDTQWEYLVLSTNIGYVMRKEGKLDRPIERTEAEEDAPTISIQPIDPIVLGPELAYRAGISIRYVPGSLHHSFEASGAVPMGGERGERLELISALRFIFNKGSHLTLGVGKGLNDAYTQSALRIFMGITFQPTDPDRDGDGIPNSKDQCPYEAEDLDGYEDIDGCPDPDNDYDGLLDIYDQCPLRPEDMNQFEDEDGCPDEDRDLDQDGIPDRIDECDLLPEDMDGFADQDGCPESDNDADGIPDEKDRCPDDSEDFDTHEDQDGCPDTDNDGDGILDIRDDCPHTPEDFDGIEDQDGCPEGNGPQEKIKVNRGRLEVKGMVFFETGKAKIHQDSHALLLEIALFLNRHPELPKIEVQGHTDATGRADSNQILSANRARAVMTFLIEEGSVDPERLTSQGYGSTRPLVSGNTSEAHAKNRRVEFMIKPFDEP